MDWKIAEQIISVFGAITMLAAYALQHLGKLNANNKIYSLMNLVGAAILTWAALRARQMGLILVEGAWTGISLVALLRQLAKSNT